MRSYCESESVLNVTTSADSNTCDLVGIKFLSNIEEELARIRIESVARFERENPRIDSMTPSDYNRLLKRQVNMKVESYLDSRYKKKMGIVPFAHEKKLPSASKHSSTYFSKLSESYDVESETLQYVHSILKEALCAYSSASLRWETLCDKDINASLVQFIRRALSVFLDKCRVCQIPLKFMRKEKEKFVHQAVEAFIKRRMVGLMVHKNQFDQQPLSAQPSNKSRSLDEQISDSSQASHSDSIPSFDFLYGGMDTSETLSGGNRIYEYVELPIGDQPKKSRSDLQDTEIAADEFHTISTQHPLQQKLKYGVEVNRWPRKGVEICLDLVDVPVRDANVHCCKEFMGSNLGSDGEVVSIGDGDDVDDSGSAVANGTNKTAIVPREMHDYMASTEVVTTSNYDRHKYDNVRNRGFSCIVDANRTTTRAHTSYSTDFHSSFTQVRRVRGMKRRRAQDVTTRSSGSGYGVDDWLAGYIPSLSETAFNSSRKCHTDSSYSFPSSSPAPSTTSTIDTTSLSSSVPHIQSPSSFSTHDSTVWLSPSSTPPTVSKILSSVTLSHISGTANCPPATNIATVTDAEAAILPSFPV